MKEKLNNLYTLIVLFLSGVVLGIGIFSYFVYHEDIFSDSKILTVLTLIVLFLLAYILQTIIHEAGHLIFGLLSGYSFISFRVGNIILIKQNDKKVLKKFSLSGTIGQCLMSPPDMSDDKTPYFLYNIGGILMNLIFAFIFYLIRIKVNVYPFDFFAQAMITIGIYNAILNGVPIKDKNVSNDGYNIISLRNNKLALKAIWLVLKSNEYLANGIRLKDIDEKLFQIDIDPSNVTSSSVLVLRENRYMDMHDFVNARKCIDELLNNNYNLNGIHKLLMKLDLLFIDIIENKDFDQEILNDKEMKAFIKSMKNFPSIIRSQYAYYLFNNNKEKVIELENNFNKVSLTYPYSSEIESEEELMSIARQTLNN